MLLKQDNNGKERELIVLYTNNREKKILIKKNDFKENGVAISGLRKSAVQKVMGRKTVPSRVKYAADCATNQRRRKSWDSHIT